MAGRTTAGMSVRGKGRLDAPPDGVPRRSPTVRVLAAYARHTDCRLAGLGFAVGADLDRLLAGTHFAAPFGQSPFAFQRGLLFERRLRAHGHAAAVAVLRTRLAFPAGPVRVVNLREAHAGAPDRLQRRARDTRALLRDVLQGRPGAPHLLDGAVLQAPVGGVTAYFEADAVAAHADGALHAAEVKSFPRVDGRVDPVSLGAALDQVALYVLLLRRTVEALGGPAHRLVSDQGLLITPCNVGLTPTLSVQGVTSRVARLERLLARVPAAADLAAALPAGTSFGPVADRTAAEGRRLEALGELADRLGTAYRPDCLNDCGNALFCRDRAFRTGDPCRLGTGFSRLLPGVASLPRAAELTRGADPGSEEAAVAPLLARAGSLYDEQAGRLALPLAGSSRHGRRS